MTAYPNGPLTRDEAIAIMRAEDSCLGTSTATIRGVEFDVFTHAPNDLRDLFTFSIEHFPNREFLVYKDERLTFTEVHQRATALAQSLLKIGIQSGDRVAIAMRNYPEYCIAIEAIVAVGAVAVLLNAWWREDELEYSLKDCGARFAFVDQERWIRIIPSKHLLDLGVAITRPDGDVPVDALSMAEMMTPKPGLVFPSQPIDTDSDALILYTSGSTGQPRGVVLTHRNTLSAAFNYMFLGMMKAIMQDQDLEIRHKVFDWIKTGAPGMNYPIAADLPPQSLLLNVPFFHVSGLVPMLLVSYTGGRKLVLMYKWNAEEALEHIEREAIISLEGVPTMVGEVLNSPNLPKHDLSSLVRVSGGGSARPPEHVKLIQERIPNAEPGTGYGMTETSAIGATIGGPDYVARPASVGHSTAPMVSIEIRDEQGNVLGPNEEGEICIKTVANMRCYWNKSEATEKTLRDGWIYSGDLGHLDEEGFLFITGRAKDIIIRGGENITCGEIEYVLYEHPAIAEAAVHGAPDDRLGEIVCATIYLREDCTATEEEVKTHVCTKLADFKVPAHVFFVEEPLLRIASGKFDKVALKQQAISALEESKSATQ